MTVEVVVPDLGESVLEATVTAWLKQEGDYVNVGDVLVELETDKVNLEVGAKSAGNLAQIKVQKGEDVKVGAVLALIDEQAAPASGAPKAMPSNGNAATASEPQAAARPERTQQATPVASRMAKDKGVDLNAVTGTGNDGRVTRADVEQFIQTQAKVQVNAPQAPAKKEAEVVSSAKPAPVSSRPEERIRMTRRRRTIAERLLEAQHSAAMLTTFNEIDMSAVMELRKRRNDEFQKRFEIKLGFMSFFVKAAIGALKAFPQLNAEIDGEDIVMKRYFDMGVAIGAAEGLVVPVLRDADRLSFADIEKQIKDFSVKTAAGKLSIEDLRGGTFTITNGGVFGSMLSTPILNPPQVGILGLHKIEERPIALNGQVVIRPMMYVALSYDHRIVDGREAVQFLVKVKELIEDPERMLLEG